MSRNVTGSSSIYKAAKWICRIVGRFGTGRLAADFSPEFQAAVIALVAACHAFEALDNYPAEVDYVAPAGPEDPAPGGAL